MPRPKSPAPAYQFHVSGQAVIRLDYQDFTFALLLAAAFGLIGGSLGIIKLPANHAKSADEVATERAVEMQNKAIQERKRRRKR